MSNRPGAWGDVYHVLRQGVQTRDLHGVGPFARPQAGWRLMVGFVKGLRQRAQVEVWGRWLVMLVRRGWRVVKGVWMGLVLWVRLRAGVA